MRKSVVWMPVLLVGAMVYWTLALGFGGLSLMGLTSDFPCRGGRLYPDQSLRDSYQSIRVNLSDSSELTPEQLNDELGSVTVDLVSDLDPRAAAAPAAGAAEERDEQGTGGRSERNSGRRSADSGPGETAF